MPVECRCVFQVKPISILAQGFMMKNGLRKRSHNKAIKLTPFPFLVLWLKDTQPQNNQLQSRNLWRRYVLEG